MPFRELPWLKENDHIGNQGSKRSIGAHDQEAEAICITKFHCMVPVDRDLAFP
jgi:hypothetical protein